MRQYQKKQCLDMIRLLNEANEELVRFIEKKQTEEAAELLEQCQQGAIRIGTLIESTEGEGTGTVRCLEEYCEVLYQLHGEMLRGVSAHVRRRLETLASSLARAEHGLRYDIKTRREAVFLPYKASMWDSLESVWKAADEDPDCDAVVIPIPYYDKNPDGSFREMHYEIARFPSGVPVVKYDAYDFGKRHPDMIFIHNPYDSGNYVTSVHPFFFARNLRQYTDRLVYIPYFILGEIDPSDQAAVAAVEHLIVTAGVIHADYVIVQSEAMRRIYVDVMMRFSGGETRPYWENKILGLGSPKVDRLYDLRKEDFALPDAWEKRIRKKDGGRRKVIFYNTSVDALLKNSELMMEKLKENLRIFEKNKEETVLLWRPHPLAEAALTALRPRLWQEYKELVRSYREAGWGIYDDSSNLYRAIAVSDGYYGDWSSVVWLYRQTGKPVMIQHVGI